MGDELGKPYSHEFADLQHIFPCMAGGYAGVSLAEIVLDNSWCLYIYGNIMAIIGKSYIVFFNIPSMD